MKKEFTDKQAMEDMRQGGRDGLTVLYRRYEKRSLRDMERQAEVE